jgi:hypothetical protein
VSTARPWSRSVRTATQIASHERLAGKHGQSAQLDQSRARLFAAALAAGARDGRDERCSEVSLTLMPPRVEEDDLLIQVRQTGLALAH